MAKLDTTIEQIPRPDIPDGLAVYDSIMGEIDEDLTSQGAKKLNEKYRNETPEQTKARAARYDAARDEYDRRYDEWKTRKQSEVYTSIHNAYDLTERIDRSKETPVLDKLEKEMNVTPKKLAA